jgi:polyphenol oxidase
MRGLITPDWKLPANIRAAVTTRTAFGVSKAPFERANLAAHVGDKPEHVAANRADLQTQLGIESITWLSQVHGVDVFDLDQAAAQHNPVADAVLSRSAGKVCAVLTADCLPVLFCDVSGTTVAAAHAGWRGLVDGVLEASVKAMRVDPARILAHIGPGIGALHFEVGSDVRDIFLHSNPAHEAHFTLNNRQRWLGNLAAIAEDRLRAVGVHQITQSGLCTYSDLTRFYSHRAEKGHTGRFASLIWIT